jgi:hypothetical protein
MRSRRKLNSQRVRLPRFFICNRAAGLLAVSVPLIMSCHLQVLARVLTYAMRSVSP